MKTTYILGAGASHAVWKFPLMKGFLKECEEQLTEPRFDGLRKFLAKGFGDLSALNLEDVLSDLDNTIHGLGSVWFGAEGDERRSKANRMQAALVRLICERLRLPNDIPPECERAYGRVFSDIRLGDSVITFNYDTGFEEYAQSSEKKDVFSDMLSITWAHDLLSDLHPHSLQNRWGWGSEHSVLLKLHGSVDYGCCSNRACPVRASIAFPRGESAGGPNAPRMCPVCGADTETVIVPPTITKTFEHVPKLSLLWRMAQRHIAASPRLVVWGFSCPASDHHVAWLLRSCRDGSALREVVVIDPDHKEVRERLRPLLDPHAEVEWAQFEGHDEYGQHAQGSGRA